jgi:hypothetical protein
MGDEMEDKVGIAYFVSLHCYEMDFAVQKIQTNKNLSSLKLDETPYLGDGRNIK